jgi:hypothetical protein
MLLQKKEKEKLQLYVSMGRNSLQQKTLPILQTKNLLRKIKTEETYMKEQTEESHRQRPYFSQKSTGDEEEAANLEKQ